ncbi:hypothetical protein [Gehongia tenuis]|uniref:DUF4105 domain-containing protein n=1 Tax=Gehongia tenuis TaxID=2763655 RepID=A0A926D6K7_9FIRM|nr:hypothetical protein [Gehongia tenuis]MBC8532196.1 hypothetical protein [Gehongia tenuis]
MSSVTRNAGSLFVEAVLLISLGGYMLTYGGIFMVFFHILSVLLPLVLGTVGIYRCVFENTASLGSRLWKNFVLILISLAILIFRDAYFTLFPILLTLYVLAILAIRGMDYAVYRHQRVPARPVLFSALAGILGIIIFACAARIIGIRTVITLSALHGIVYGLYTLWNAFSMAVIAPDLPRFRPRHRMLPPLFITTFLPYGMLRLMRSSPKAKVLLEENARHCSANGPADMEVLIHVTKKDFGIVGHVDFVFEGTVYSYGSFDDSSHRLNGALGDGVLMMAESKTEYIRFCQSFSEKTLFTYGLKLTEEQKAKVRLKLDRIMMETEPWQAPIRHNPAAGDYASTMTRAFGASYRRFTGGRFKTYFILRTNCSFFLEEILDAVGFEAPGWLGIPTPGSYYSLLEQYFLEPQTPVVAKHLYA